MKILIYGEGYWFGLATPLKIAFESLGNEVDLFDWTKYLFRSKKANFTNKVLDRLLVNKVANEINNGLMEFVKQNKYDLLLVLQGKHLYSETLLFTKKYCTHVLNWNIDDFFNPNVRTCDLNSFQHYDWILSARKHLFPEYYNKGAKNIECINWFYYPEKQHPVKVEEKEYLKWGSDLAFMGTLSKHRENTLKELDGFNLKIWGSGWHKAGKEFKNKFILMYQEAWFEEMSKVCNATKIIVDVLTAENNDTTNLKNFQIPACGGFLMSNRTDAILELFDEDKEIVCYSSFEELRSKCNYYLQNERERKKIATNAFNKVTNGNNSVLDRAIQILEIIK